MSNNPLFDLTVAAATRAKEAAVNVGAQLVMPTMFGNHGAGIIDPDPNLAGHQRTTELRAAANYQNYMDNQIVGTNLAPQRNVLNEMDQTIAYAVNPPTMGMPQQQMGGQQKMANLQKQAAEEWRSKMASTGLFQKYVPESPDEWNKIEGAALQKTASDTEALIAEMINSGYMQQVAPHLVPIFLG